MTIDQHSPVDAGPAVHDPAVAAAVEAQTRSTSAARLFDVRRVIGLLFLVYGVILLVLGINPSEADLAKAGGVNINLWTGVCCAGLGALFLLWMWLRPLPVEPVEPVEPAVTGRPDGPVE